MNPFTAPFFAPSFNPFATNPFFNGFNPSPFNTPFNTINQTPFFNTPFNTPINTINQTPFFNSPFNTPISSINPTPFFNSPFTAPFGFNPSPFGLPFVNPMIGGPAFMPTPGSATNPAGKNGSPAPVGFAPVFPFGYTPFASPMNCCTDAAKAA